MSGKVTCDYCGNPNNASARSCYRCHKPLPHASEGSVVPRAKPPTRAQRLVIRIVPIGTALTDAVPIPLEEGVRTLVGRESVGPIGSVMDALEAEFPDVGREHMYLTARGQEVEIDDNSQFGTWVDGRRLGRGEPVSLRVPVTLRLASGCIVEVRLERTP